ncbi:MAG: C1 family peptidase [Bacteroidia bacterium]
MKKQFISAIIALSALSMHAQTKEATQAPLNPLFEKYISNKEQNKLTPQVTAEGKKIGSVIPSILEPNFDAYLQQQQTLKSSLTLPAVYDMRTNGKITSVKDQGDCGSCWLFPTIGSVESSWKVLGLGTFDLSEDNLKNCHGFQYLPCDGGSREMAVAYFTRNSGPFLESQDPYSDNSTGCPSGLAPAAYITDARFLPKNKNAVKQALFNYGAVYTTFHWDDPAFRDSDNTYYYSGTSDDLNHAVLIVGWDDNKPTAAGTGAWIVKNSWGSSWAENGFFYISYNDTRVLTDATYYPARVNYRNDVKVNGYDHLGMTTSIGFGSSTAYGLVRFVPTTNEKITKIGTWVTGSNAKITIDVYNSFSGSSLTSLMGSIPQKTCALPGYYTFDLPTPINVTAGNDYYIRVKYQTPGNNFPLPIESKISGYSNSASFETGKCWTAYNASSWTPIGNGTTEKYDLCIKAYVETIAATCLPITNATVAASAATSCVGGSNILSVTTNSVATSYQWKISTNGSTWTNVTNSSTYSGANTATLTISGITSTLNNKKYRCVVGNACSSTNSTSLTLIVDVTPTVTTQPLNKSIVTGTSTSFTFSSTGTNKTYQWQMSTNGGTSWTNVTNNTIYSNVTGVTLSVSGATMALNNRRFRCKITNACGTVYTNAAKLTVSPVQLPDDGNSNNDKMLVEHYLPIMDENVVLSTNNGIELNSAQYELRNNYPNPFVKNTRIAYNIPEDAFVTISVHNLLGKQVGLIVNETKLAGDYEVDFDATELPAGHYTYTMQAIGKSSTYAQTKTMVLIKE